MIMKDEMNLTKIKTNEIASIVDISKGCSAKKRLYELGLHKGVEFKVIKNDIGPIILKLSGNKLAIGRGLAEKVVVSK